jgi:CheY-like chemotaxis protein
MRNPLTILVAEDNADDLFLLEQAFRKASATSRLLSVSDGHEAIAYLKGEGQFADREAFPCPDILLLDLNMPRANGFEVLEWVRKQAGGERLIVHVLTSSCRDEDVSRVYDLQANSYVVKPSQVNDLVDFVAALHTWHRFVCLPPNPRGLPTICFPVGRDEVTAKI